MSTGKSSRIHIERVYPHEMMAYNTSNYPPQHQGDSTAEIRRTGLCHYVHLTNYQEVRLGEQLMEILTHCNTVQRLEPLRDYEAELEACGLFDGRKWFFRFSSSSPKDGTPRYPVITARDVLEKIATSMRASYPLEYKENVLYFTPFHEDWDDVDEFRVFVYHHAVTAISTYRSEYTEYTDWCDSKLVELAEKIIRFQQNLDFDLEDNFPSNYVLDVRFNGEGIELIEFNSFGYWLAAGSALFDWMNDYEQLYSKGEKVVFRLASF